MKNAFHVGYPCPVRKQYDPALFQLRDHVAFSDMTMPLADLGYRYKDPICLYPYRDPELGDFQRGEEYYDFIGKDDFLFLTTRLPLDDGKSNDKKHIIRSQCHLEKHIFEALQPYFEVCSRSTVRLSKTLMKNWAKSRKVKVDSVPAHFNFRQNLDARIAATATLDEEVPTKDNYPANYYHSIGFFLNVPEIPHYGCRCAASFGMGGDETSVWNRWVSANRPEWLEKPRFVVALMQLDNTPQTPVTLQYAEKIEVNVLLDYEIPAK